MLILTGASASGKTVTALGLQRKYPLIKAITTTTRTIREGEKDGVDYFFLSKEEFIKKMNDNFFVETTLYNSNYYGCGKDQVSDNKVIVLDPNGLHSFLKLNDSHIVTFLLICDEKIREERMHNRKDDPIKIKERLTNDKIDFDIKNIGKTDFVIDTSNKSIDEVIDLVYTQYIEELKKR